MECKKQCHFGNIPSTNKYRIFLFRPQIRYSRGGVYNYLEILGNKVELSSTLMTLADSEIPKKQCRILNLSSAISSKVIVGTVFSRYNHKPRATSFFSLISFCNSLKTLSRLPFIRSRSSSTEIATVNAFSSSSVL
eukprot:IDg6878t1